MVRTSNKKWYEKWKNIFLMLGISLSGVVAGIGWACNQAETKIVKPYIQQMIKSEFSTLHQPQETEFAAVKYDVKLTRYMLEEIVPDDKKQLAILKLNDTTWKTK